jgi:hypothetical protein
MALSREISVTSSLEPGILLLKLSRPYGLLYTHATILFAPTVVGLLGDADLLLALPTESP